jgi:PadR family transcriptional regulator PadR
MYDLTGFQRDLRYVIAGVDEPDGPGTNEELGSDHDGEVHHGRRYPNLDTPV